jgi:1,2-diacylglycerol 3-beta-galactosyltransferase
VGKKICIITADAGGGHRVPARAIRCILSSIGYDVTSIEVYKQILVRRDITKKFFGLTTPDFYNKFVLIKGFSGFSWKILGLFAIIYIVLRQKSLVNEVSRFFKNQRADLYISVVPLVNDILVKGIDRISPKSKLLTIVVDYIQPAKYIWFQNRNQIVAVNTVEAKYQALKSGIPQKNVFLLSGPVISPSFYEHHKEENKETKISINLCNCDRYTLLLIWGGYGSVKIVEYAHILNNLELPIQVIYVCGKNSDLKREINKMSSKNPVFIFGYVENMAPLYSVADLIVGKPGPGVIAEAVFMNVPLLLECNRRTLAQERFNIQWVIKNKVGHIFSGPSSLKRVLMEMLNKKRLSDYRKSTKLIKNNGLFEVIKIIDELVNRI